MEENKSRYMDDNGHPTEARDTDENGITGEGCLAMAEPTNESAWGHLESYSAILHGRTLLNSSRPDFCKGSEKHTRHNLF